MIPITTGEQCTSGITHFAADNRDGTVSEQERDLINRAQNGDKKAFNMLIIQYQEMAYSISYQMLGNAEDAKDVCQESFIKLYRHLGKYQHRHKFSTWLYRLVVNSAIDFQRRIKKTDCIDVKMEKELPGDSSWTNSDLKLSLDDLLCCLTPTQRRAFVLRDLQEFSMSEVAKILNCNTITVRVHLYNARQKLRIKLEKDL